MSHWNPHPDFGALYGKGMRFLISKASQGTSFVDATFARRTREARAAGLAAGAYHFFDYTKGGRAQARHFLATVRASSGLSRLLPLVVDVETLSSLGKPNKALARQRLHGLIDELYAQTGRYPMIYTSRYMWEQVVGGPLGFGRYRLWVACWKCDTVHLPAGWSSWDFWQVGQFRLGGGLRLDGNVWRGSLAAMKQQRQRPMRLARGAEWSGSRAVEADLRGFDGSDVRYGIDDAGFGAWQPYSRRFEVQLAARQGRQDVRLQLRNFRGVTTRVLRDSIRLDTMAPTVTGPLLRFRAGVRVQRTGARVPTLVEMGASDAGSGLGRTRLAARCGARTRAAQVGRGPRDTLQVQIDRHGCTLIGRATDTVGNTRARELAPSVSLIDLRRRSGVRLQGGWQILGAREALGGTLARASSPAASARVTVEGGQLAIVARRGPAGGRLKVFIDGQQVGTVDLHAGAGDARRIVFVRDLPGGRHTLLLRPAGTGRPASRGTTVWLDAVLVLDKRR